MNDKEFKEFIRMFYEVSEMTGELYDAGLGIKESIEIAQDKNKKAIRATDQS